MNYANYKLTQYASDNRRKQKTGPKTSSRFGVCFSAGSSFFMLRFLQFYIEFNLHNPYNYVILLHNYAFLYINGGNDVQQI